MALPGALPAVPPLDERLLPDALRPWLNHIAERAQVPLDFPAASSIVALSSAIGRRIGIYPKRKDEWLVIPNLWGFIVGPPSALKSPMLHEVLKPLVRLEAQARDEHRKLINIHERDRLAGRGYDYNDSPTVEPEWQNGSTIALIFDEPRRPLCCSSNCKCEWCHRAGVLRCGACDPTLRTRPAKRMVHPATSPKPPNCCTTSSNAVLMKPSCQPLLAAGPARPANLLVPLNRKERQCTNDAPIQERSSLTPARRTTP
jgi:hypothetical protein